MALHTIRTLSLFLILLTARRPFTHAVSNRAIIEISSALPLLPATSLRARCTSLPPNICCRAIDRSSRIPLRAIPFAGDYASFQNLPQDAVSSLHTWNGAPSLPANPDAACSQQMVDISGKTNWIWSANAAGEPDSNGNAASKTSKLITGAKYFICPLGKKKPGSMGNLVGYFRNSWADVVKMCVGGVATSGFAGTGPVRRRERRGRSMQEEEGHEESWAYPDVIILNGTEYSNEHRNDLVYRDARGNVFDLELLRGYR